VIASTLIYFDGEFAKSLSDIFEDFQNCRDSQRYHFSLSNWKIIIASLDHFLVSHGNSETGFDYDLEEDRLVLGDKNA
jgi:predicted  nucleic acid-binding Zn-ribbon protein